MAEYPTRPSRPTPASGIPPLTSTVEFLATVPLFHELDLEELRRFGELVREKSYPKSSVIVFEDDPGDAFFIVREGRVKVVRVGDDGREVILDRFGPGDHFGELALIDNGPRSAHVVAIEDATLLVLRRDDFRRRVEESPKVAWALLGELSRRLRSADDQISSLVLLDVPGRIARLLLDHITDESTTIEQAITHQTIAQMIGASRETVSRSMRDFQQMDWISVDKRRITLTDVEALRKRARARE